MNSSNNIFHSLVIALLLSSVNAAYANPAGHVQFVNGEVQLTTSAGQTHSVKKGDAVNEGDTLTSARNAAVQIKMLDGGIVAMRPDTKLKFDSFKFSGKEDGSEQSFFSLMKGGFRAVTGLIGRINKPSYRVTTPMSTIGIRGTDHETFVVLPDSPLAAVAPTGTYNKVNLGETFMTTDKGTIFVLPNQMGFAGSMDQMPRIQPINTNLFTVTPAPQAKGGRKEEGQEVRASAAVDNTAQEQAAVPASTAAAPGNTQVDVVTTTIPQLPITTAGGGSLTGGGTTGALPAQGQGGITFFSTNVAGGFSSGFSDTVTYTSDTGLSTFTALSTGYSGTRGTATVVDHVSVPLSGTETLAWGRWAGAGATVSSPVATAPVFNLQYVGGNPVPLMPVTGAANYIPVGGTGPIDSTGTVVGQFTGATVTADFAAAKLTVGINLSANGVAYAANGTVIYAANGVIPVTPFATVTCAPACVSPASGDYAGAFVGTNATGLGLVYHVTNPNAGLDIAGAQGFVRR